MNLLVGMICGVVLAAGVCAFGVAVGRRDTTKLHQIAFKAGLAGLVAVPLWFLGLLGLLSQLFWAEISSAAGIIFVAASAVLLVSSVYVIWTRVRLHRGDPRLNL